MYKNKKYVVIVAGGVGKRMEAKIPKQFLEIAKTPILMHTISTFFSYDNFINIILALPEKQIPQWEKLCTKHNFKIKHQIVKGGETRFHSVKNGLNVIEEEGIVAIHDGVRPFVKKSVIRNCFDTAKKLGNAAPYIDPTDSVRIETEESNKPIDRSFVKLMQTPQTFDTIIIKKSYEQNYSSQFTDDVSVLEKTGIKINLVKGNKENIKITTPFDILIAETIIKGI